MDQHGFPTGLTVSNSVDTVAEVSITSATSESVVEGPLGGIDMGDALARAHVCRPMPTGTRTTNIPGILRPRDRHFLVHPPRSGWLTEA